MILRKFCLKKVKQLYEHEINNCISGKNSNKFGNSIVLEKNVFFFLRRKSVNIPIYYIIRSSDSDLIFRDFYHLITQFL
jgi:hypothetical protein